MPRLVTPVDSAYLGLVSVRCLHPFPAKMPGGDRRLLMNLDLSLLVNTRISVHPARARTKASLPLSAARSRPWSLERQPQEGCRGPLLSDHSHVFFSSLTHSLFLFLQYRLVFVLMTVVDLCFSYAFSRCFRPVVILSFYPFCITTHSHSIPVHSTNPSSQLSIAIVNHTIH